MKHLCAMFAVAFPQREFGILERKAYVTALNDLPAHLMRPAAISLIQESEYFPTIAKVRTRVLELSAAERADKARDAKQRIAACSECGGSGWVEPERGTVDRCRCHETAVQAINALPALPRALPAAGDDAD